MSYKDLLVVLDPDAAARGRIDLAVNLAERFAAHLVGLYPLPVPVPPSHLGYYDPALLDPFFANCVKRRRKKPRHSARLSSRRLASAAFRRSGAWLTRGWKPIRRSMPATPI